MRRWSDARVVDVSLSLQRSWVWYAGGPMSWKLIFGLSLFGLAMGFATVFVVPSRTEPLVWLGIFLVCAYLIAKYAPRRYFFHGVCVGLLNSVCVTGAHVALF